MKGRASTKMGRKPKKSANAGETLSNELGISKIALDCPACGSNLKIDLGHMQTYCQFCGSSLPKAEEILKLSYQHMEKNKDRDLELKRMKHEKKIVSKKTFFSNVKAVIGLISIIMIFIWMVLIFIIALR